MHRFYKKLTNLPYLFIDSYLYIIPQIPLSFLGVPYIFYLSIFLQNAQKKTMKKYKNQNAIPKLFLLRLMTEENHGQPRSHSATEKRKKKKRPFRNTPCPIPGPHLISPKKKKRDQIHGAPKNPKIHFIHFYFPPTWYNEIYINVPNHPQPVKEAL